MYKKIHFPHKSTSTNFRKDRTALFIVGGFDTERDGAGEVRDEAGLVVKKSRQKHNKTDT